MEFHKDHQIGTVFDNCCIIGSMSSVIVRIEKPSTILEPSPATNSPHHHHWCWQMQIGFLDWKKKTRKIWNICKWRKTHTGCDNENLLHQLGLYANSPVTFGSSKYSLHPDNSSERKRKMQIKLAIKYPFGTWDTKWANLSNLIRQQN